MGSLLRGVLIVWIAVSAHAEIVFEEDQGRFLARTRGGRVRFTPAAITFATEPPVAIELDRRARLVGEQLLPVRIHEYRGTRRRENIRGFAAIRYENVSRGIDLRFYGHAEGLEFDVIVKPGARPSDFWFRLAGADSIRRINGALIAGAADSRTRWPS